MTAVHPIVLSIRRRGGECARRVAVVLALILNPLWAQAAQKESEVDIVAALAAGRDTSIEAAAANTQKSQAAVPGVPRSVSATERFAVALRELQAAIESLRADGNEEGIDLHALIQRLRAADVLVEAEFDALSERSVGATAATLAIRIADARQRWRAQADPIIRAAEAVAVDSRNPLPARLDHLRELMQKSKSTPISVYGSSVLPVHRPRFSVRLPQLSLNVAPSYATSAIEVLPEPEDFAAGHDATLSPAVLAQATALGNDYIAIADFVRTQIRTQWYVGAQKGADETLRTRAGNDIDQASLLIALLRASHAAARYVTGVVELPAPELATQLGIAESRVGAALAGIGIAHQPVIRQGNISAYRIEQVWVAAYLPMGNYRGSAADLRAQSWIPLMPALKPVQFTPAQPTLLNAGVNLSNWIETYLTTPAELAPWPTLRNALNLSLAQRQPPLVLEAGRAQHPLTATPLTLLPASTPFSVVAVNLEAAELLDEQRQWLRLVMRSGAAADSPIVFTSRWPLSTIQSRRLGLGYVPSTVEDQHLVNAAGGLSAIPAYLIRVRPSVWLDGQPLAAGTSDLAIGSTHRLELELSGPAGSVTGNQLLRAGGVAALALDPQGESSPVNEDLTASEPQSLQLLGRFAQRYQQDWSRDDADFAGLLGTSVFRPLPAATLVIGQYRNNEVLGLTDNLEFEGVAIDALLRPVEPISQRGDVAIEADWLRLSSLQGSALEHRLFKQLWAVDALSADSGLQLASSRGIPRLRVLPGQNVSSLLAAHSLTVREQIAGWLARGMEVDVPRDPMTVESWSGSVWRVVNPASGESGFFLSGGYAGGVTLIPPDFWFFEDLVSLLANPYGGAPSNDPMSGSRIALSAEAQDQYGTVGQELPLPLLAHVADEFGRPVLGASVEFRVRHGGGTLIGEGGTGTSVVANTDEHGIAAVRLRLAQLQQGRGSHFFLSGQEFPQWATSNEIDVIVATTNGRLFAEVPYRAHAFPSEAREVVLQRTGPTTVNPGLLYSSYVLFVRDEFGNPISNQLVSVSAADSREPLTCIANLGSALPSAVFLPGDCPVDGNVLRFLGHPCVKSEVTTKTRPLGALVHIAVSDVPATRVTVTATGPAGASPATELLTTFGQLTPRQTTGLDPDQSCRVPILGSVVQWYHGLNGYGASQLSGAANGLSIEAGLPNALLPAARRFAFALGGGGFGTPSVLWGAIETDSFSVESTGATAEGSRPWALGDEYDLRAGNSPGEVNGVLSITAQAFGSSFGTQTFDTEIPKAWVLNLPSPLSTPARIVLSPFQRSTQDIILTAGYSPLSYLAASAVIELLEDGEVTMSCARVRVSGTVTCPIGRGRYFDPSKRYTARYSINHGTPFFMQSSETQIVFSRGIVVGFGGNDDNKPLPALNSFVAGHFPKRIQITHEVDISSQFRCDNPTRLVYALGQPAKVSLSFFRLNPAGGSGILYWQPLDQATQPAGVHEQALRLADLPFGQYQYELRVTAVSDGAEEVFVGHVTSQIDRHDSLSLAHSFVKGVDLFLGNAVVSAQDMAVSGRGPGMHFTRTYSSHSGDQVTSLGRGWHSDLDASVQLDRCGTYIVTGSVGQGQRFVAAGQAPDGSLVFNPLHGYHSTLYQRADGSFDVFAKDGTRQHFAASDARLEFIEDPNGNRVSYTYEVASGRRLVNRITDSAGRQFDLTYESVEQVEGGTAGQIEVRVSHALLSRLRGPVGMEVRYSYDANGNLATVTRTQAGASGERREHYHYVDKGGVWVADPDGQFNYHHFGFRLERVRDDIANSERRYDYQLQWSAVITPNGPAFVPEQRVIELVEPDAGSTKFTYAGVRGLGVMTPTTVEDARGHSTVHQLNAYGSAERVTDPVGETSTVWNFAHQQPAQVTDALGTVTTYTYDSFGNTTRERIAHVNGSLQRDWTYVPPSAFGVPITNRVQTHTDARRIVTTTSWDARGNLIGTSRGGVTESFGVLANGDRSSRTDGNADSTQYRYDSYGLLIEARDALGLISAASFDAIGRQRSASDGNGQVTEFEYDALDRRVLTRHPATRIGLDGETLRSESTTQYNDSQRRRIDTDENGHASITTFDTMGRTLSVTNALLDTRTFVYDKNGNRTSETDFRGNATTMVFDAANRMTERHQPLGRSTIYTHDNLGHVLSETTAERVTEYRYAHPLYLATHTRRKLETRWLETVTGFDENGNPTSTTDPRGKITTRQFDDRDRLIQQTEPEGRLTVLTHDGADRKRSETLSG
ncbi:MAG: DUF6531 domain-containing protein, partial [Pseudomarimonas sp.]